VFGFWVPTLYSMTLLGGQCKHAGPTSTAQGGGRERWGGDTGECEHETVVMLEAREMVRGRD